jgi:radical SAM family uncharacterized protein
MISMHDRVDLWERVEPLLDLVEKPARYIDHEFGAVRDPESPFRCVLIYPDTYEVGLPNQGLAILYKILNAQPGIACERSYTPWVDMANLMRARNLPLFSMESCFPVASFDMVGIQLPHELAATNIVETLELAGIPVMAADRAQDDPIVCGGGPSVYNPEAVCELYDCIMIGDGEEVIVEVAECIRDQRAAGAARADILMALSQIPGVYVPVLYDVEYDAQGRTHLVPKPQVDVPKQVVKRVVADFKSFDPINTTLVPYPQVVQDRLAVEVLRGCARGCRFCQAGMTYRPVRERPADQIVAAVLRGLACTGYDEVSLTSLSTTDHSNLENVLRRLNSELSGKGISVSLPSERLDSFGIEMAQLVAGEKKGGLTFAPEAGTQRMRDVINKGITEEDLMNAVRASFSQGWMRMKLYFMMGLPTETDEDVLGIAELCRKALELAKSCVPPQKRCAVRIGTSVAVFIPKAQTAFQWCAQMPPDEVRRRQQLLVQAMPRGVDLRYHDYASSFLEAVLSRSGREALPLVLEAHRLGARFDAWSDQFKLSIWEQAASNIGFDMQRAACEPFDMEGPLPWDHISAGVSQRYLRREWDRAQEGVLTPDCTMSKCSGCGVCPSLHVDNDLERSRS